MPDESAEVQPSPSAEAALASDSVDLLVSIARARQDDQLRHAASLSNRVGAAFSLDAAAVALFGAALALSSGALSGHVWALFAADLFLFVVSLVFAYRATWLDDWHVRPSLTALDALVHQAADHEIKLWTAREIMQALDDNERLLLKKDVNARRAITFAIADVVMIGVTALVATNPFG